MKTSRKQLLKRLGCAILAFVMVLGTVLTIPFVFELPIFAAADETFDSGAVLIDSSYNGKNILIRGKEVFSVTVVGATGVNIIFEDVTMDRRFGTDEKKAPQFPGFMTSRSLWDGSLLQTANTISPPVRFSSRKTRVLPLHFAAKTIFMPGRTIARLTIAMFIRRKWMAAGWPACRWTPVPA